MTFLIIYIASVLIVGILLIKAATHDHYLGFDITVRDIALGIFGVFTPFINTIFILFYIISVFDDKSSHVVIKGKERN